MKQSEKVLDDFHKRQSELKQGITDLRHEIKKDGADLEDKKQQYEDYVGAGEDDKADSLLDDIEVLETSIKRKSKRLQTKQRLQKKAEMENVASALSYTKHIKKDFQSEVKENDEKILKLFEQLETALDERKGVSEEFKDIYTQYIDVKEANKPTDEEDLKEFSSIIRPFSVGYTTPDIVNEGFLLKNQIKAFKKDMGGNK